jgi:hypothetical protein
MSRDWTLPAPNPTVGRIIDFYDAGFDVDSLPALRTH